MIATLNGSEISGSQAALQLGSLTGQIFPMANSFLANCTAGDVLKLRAAGSTATNQLTAAVGLGVTDASISLTITRIK